MTRNQISLMEARETHRTNIARELETERSNRAKEAETYRSNRAKEEETRRANLAQESILFSNAQTNRMQAVTQASRVETQNWNDTLVSTAEASLKRQQYDQNAEKHVASMSNIKADTANKSASAKQTNALTKPKVAETKSKSLSNISVVIKNVVDAATSLINPLKGLFK